MQHVHCYVLLKTQYSTIYSALCCFTMQCVSHQRWSPRGRPWPQGQILKSLALASKVKSLASRPQVLENWPVLGSRTALFFELLKFCEALEKLFGKRFFVEIARKISVKTFFFLFGDRLKNFCDFGEHLRLCPWSLASRVSVLGKAVLGLGLVFFCVLGLEPCVLNSTSVSHVWLNMSDACVASQFISKYTVHFVIYW